MRPLCANLPLLIVAATLAACASSPDLTRDRIEWSAADAAQLLAARERPAAMAPVADERRNHRRNEDSRTEVTLQGGGSSDERFRAGSGQLAGTLGYYVNEVVQLAVRQNLSISDSGSSASETYDGATRFAIDFHIPIDNVVPQVTPYVGVNIGFIYGDSVGETFAAGPEVGLKYFVKPDVFLQIGAEYDFSFSSSNRIDRAFENGSLFYGIGFGVCY